MLGLSLAIVTAIRRAEVAPEAMYKKTLAEFLLIKYKSIFCQHGAHIFSAFWQNMKAKLELEMSFCFEFLSWGGTLIFPYRGRFLI